MIEITKMKQRLIDGSDVSGILQQARETIKSKEEVQLKDEKVQAKIFEIKTKQKREPLEGTGVHQAARQQQCLEAQDEILALSAPVGKMTTLWELHTLNHIVGATHLKLREV